MTPTERALTRYMAKDADDADARLVESANGNVVKFADVQQLCRDVLVRITHHELCEVFRVPPPDAKCDCGISDLLARLKQIAGEGK